LDTDELIARFQGMIEALEGRALLSAVPVIAADQEKLRLDVLGGHES
jgi:hypothetical protein